MQIGISSDLMAAVRELVADYQGEPTKDTEDVLSDLAALMGRFDVPQGMGYEVKNAVAQAAIEMLDDCQRTSLIEALSSAIDLRLRRIVYLAPDLSTIGGIQNRTRKILGNAGSRQVEYVGLSVRRRGSIRAAENLCWEDGPEHVCRTVRMWSPQDTVVVFPNNSLRALPTELRTLIDRLPLIFLGSGQLSFLIQDSPSLADPSYSSTVRATKCIVLSEADRETYRQFGLHDRIVGFHPTEVRLRLEDRRPSPKPRLGYVGRIDFYTKGADRLLEAALVVRNLGLGRLKIFSPDLKTNSPDLPIFLDLVRANNLQEHIDLRFNENDPEVLYSEIDLLLVPSRKDSFPNVVLEAFSFGVPVIATSYAPGPSRLIEHGRTGFLLENFTYDELVRVIEGCDHASLRLLSQSAFADHSRYGLSEYYDFIETIGWEALRDFIGYNQSPVFPELRPIAKLQSQLQRERKRLRKERRRRKTAEKEAKKLRTQLDAAEDARRLVKASIRYRLGSSLIDQPRTLSGALTLPMVLISLFRQHRQERRLEP